MLAGLTSQYGLRGKTWRGQSATPVPLLVLRSLGVELGWPLSLIFPIAAAVCLARGGARARAALLALSVVLTLLLYHSLQSLFLARFLLPCTPFLTLIVALGLGALREGGPAPVGAPADRPGGRPHPPPRLPRGAERLPRSDPPAARHAAAGQGVCGAGGAAGEYDRRRLRVGHIFLLGAVSAAGVRSLVQALERSGFARMTFSPLRDGGDLPVELDQIYLPYRHLFRYERPGPMIVIYVRPGMPAPPDGLRR